MSIDFYDPKFIQNNPWQTRISEPDAAYIESLAQDIQKNGLLQTPMGRLMTVDGAGTVQLTFDGKGAVQLAFGHNRLRAYLHLGLSGMPVDVRELSDEQMAILAWSENEKRRDHTPIERARAIQKRIEDFGWSNRECAEQLGIDHSTVSNILRLLKLPEDVQQLLLEGKLTERQAEALLPIYDVPANVNRDFGYWSYPAGGTITLNSLAEIAVKKGLTSDIIRRVVEGYFQDTPAQLKDAEFKLDQMFTETEDIYCGTCKTCDRRMPSRNLCFDRGCYGAKTERLHLDYLNQASFVTGYPVDDPGKGGRPTELPALYYPEMRKKIIASKCPNLVLVYQRGAKDFDAYPNVALVCTKRNDSCSCLKGLKALSKGSVNVTEQVQEADDIDGDADEGEGLKEPITELPKAKIENQAISSEHLEEAARQARKQKMEVNKARLEIREMLAGRLFEDLKCWLPGALYAATQGLYPNKEDLDIYKIFEKLAKSAAHRMISDYQEFDSKDHLMKYINGCLEKLQLEPFSLEEKKAEPVEIDREEPSIPVF